MITCRCGHRAYAGYVAEGLFDVGITGRDWVEETGAVIESPDRPRPCLSTRHGAGQKEKS